MTGIDNFSKFNFDTLMPWAYEIPKCIKIRKELNSQKNN